MDEKIKIVVADDDSSLVLLLKFRLENEGYVTHVAKDGKEAIDLIELHNPNLIISDIMMPIKNGLEVVEHVRFYLKSKVPIILFSKAGHEEIVMRSFKLGINDFLNKPFIVNELLIRIERMLTKTQI